MVDNVRRSSGDRQLYAEHLTYIFGLDWWEANTLRKE
jgi:hypothetical protein